MYNWNLLILYSSYCLLTIMILNMVLFFCSNIGFLLLLLNIFSTISWGVVSVRLPVLLFVSVTKGWWSLLCFPVIRGTISLCFLWSFCFSFIRYFINAYHICSGIQGYALQICVPLQFHVFLPGRIFWLDYQLVFAILIYDSKSDRLGRTGSSVKYGYALIWLFSQVSGYCHIASYFKSHCLFSFIRFLFCLLCQEKLKPMFLLASYDWCRHLCLLRPTHAIFLKHQCALSKY